MEQSPFLLLFKRESLENGKPLVYFVYVNKNGYKYSSSEHTAL